jgi:hypothetical protein
MCIAKASVDRDGPATNSRFPVIGQEPELLITLLALTTSFDASAQYQYRETQLVLAYTIGAPK